MRKQYISTPFFSSRLIEWYEENKRILPWRLTNNPYFIWLSEIILQQTRVEQGLPYYSRFIENYPRITDLASASQDEVFKLWQGLGYYNRARNLHETAKLIVAQYNGVFPTSYEDVISLKGIGDYTAAAIMSFAYNAPYAAVDGNVYRVLSRVFGIEEYIDTSAGKKFFQELATELLDRKRAGLFNQAIMDFGSLQCTPKSPVCQECPFADICVAYNNRLVDVLPRKKGKVVVRKRYFNYIDVREDGKLFVKKRVGKDIWQNLYEFPLIETEQEVSFEKLSNEADYLKLFSESSDITVLEKKTFKHILSHQVIHATFYRIKASNVTGKSYIQIEEEELEKYGVSRLIHKYLEELNSRN